MDLHVKVDMTEFRRRMIGFESDIPFAISMAMMRTCNEANDLVRRTLKENFTIRNEWAAKGIRCWPGNTSEARIFKKQIQATGDATALVGSRDEFMIQQAEGLTDRLGRKHRGKRFAVPQVGEGMPRETIKTITTPSKWPGKLAQKRGIWIGRLRANREDAVWRRVIRPIGAIGPGGLSTTRSVISRTRRKSREGERRGIELLYSLASKVEVKPQWPLLRRVEAVFARKWIAHTEAAITWAIHHSRGMSG